MWVVPRSNLSEDQLNAVLMSTDKHRIIVGGPGAGKTLALAHRTRRLLDDGMATERVRFLVYTSVLSNYLRAGLKDLGVPSGTVSTFDKWCIDLHKDVVGGRIPFERGAHNSKPVPDFKRIRSIVLDAIRSSGEAPRLDAVLVDEAQDLDATALELIRAVARHVTLAMDSRQQLWPGNADLSTASRILGVPHAAGALLTAYRCTPLIVDLASAFLPAEEAEKFRRSNLMPLAEREIPVLHEFASDADELDTVAGHLATRSNLGESAAVLVPFKKQIEPFVKELGRRGVRAVGMKDAKFDDQRPLVTTYHSAKGLTVDSVLLPGLIEGSFTNFDSDRLLSNLFFVGITRATRWVWLGARVGTRLPAVAGFGEIDSLVQSGSLRRLGPTDLASNGRSTAPADRPAGRRTGSSIADILD